MQHANNQDSILRRTIENEIVAKSLATSLGEQMADFLA